MSFSSNIHGHYDLGYVLWNTLEKQYLRSNKCVMIAVYCSPEYLCTKQYGLSRSIGQGLGLPSKILQCASKILHTVQSLENGEVGVIFHRCSRTLIILVEVHSIMLHNKYPSSRVHSFWQKDFHTNRTLWVKSVLTQGILTEQSW